MSDTLLNGSGGITHTARGSGPHPGVSGGAYGRSSRSEAPCQRILGEKQRRLFFLDPKDVESVVADRNYVSLNAGGETYVARVSLQRLEGSFAGTSLVRVHRSLMINLDHVHHMERGVRGTFLITLKSGARVRSSPLYRANLLARTAIEG